MSSPTELGFEVLRALWLSVPVLFAAALQILVIKQDWLRRLKRPIDGGRCLGGVRVFGDNKTWRGLLVYVGGAAVGALGQGLLRFPRLEIPGVDYARPLELALLGALLGLGFAVGELPNSFCKRRRGIAPGARGSPFWVVMDQVDSLFGCLLALCVLWIPPWTTWAVVLGLGVGLHIAFNGVFVLLGLKKSVF
ncbi:MAG: CDP-archaeol synthase [Planctomycetota bacterium]|nr:MAG: CDP-archaeol synthase [Planctomycetota bacterium]